MTKKKSIKKEVITIPASVQEAIEDEGRIGMLQRRINRINNVLDNNVQRLTQKAAEKIAPRQEEIVRLAEGIFIFAQAHRKELTEDETKKTIDWSTGQIMWRWNPYSVDYRNKKATIAALKAKELDRFIRIEEEINKEAILQEKEVVKDIKEITIVHKEMFIIKPAKTEIEIPKEIKIPKK